ILAANAASNVKRHVDIGIVTTPTETGREVAQLTGHVQYLVVEREIVRWDQLDTGMLLLFPVRTAQLGTGGAQPGAGEIPLPVGPGGFFQFTAFADTRKAEIVGAGHGSPARYCAASHGRKRLQTVYGASYMSKNVIFS